MTHSTMTTPDSIARDVRRLAVPAILSSLLQTLVFVVDRAMLGHYGETALAGMQVAGPLEWSLWSVFSAFEVGTVARVGWHVGANDPASARRAALLSIYVALAAGSVVAIIAPFLLPLLGHVYPTASAEAISQARDYLVWTLGASPIVFLGASAIAILQASGDTRTPLYIGIGVNILHVVSNRILILGAFGLAPMGMRGAGISTSCTLGLEAVWMIAALTRRSRSVSLLRSGARTTKGGYAAEWKALARVANPAVLERILYHLGYLGFVFVIGQLGDAAMAANQSLLSAEAICWISADGFGVAAAALVAQRLGAKSPRDAERAARTSARYAVILLTSVGLLFLATRWLVLPLFSDDAEVIAIGAAAVPILAVAQPFMAVTIVFAHALRGAGMTKQVLGVSAVGAFCVRIACTWLFAITLGMGLTGVWVGSTCDWLARGVLLVWLGRVKTREANAPT